MHFVLIQQGMRRAEKTKRYHSSVLNQTSGGKPLSRRPVNENF